MQKAIKWVLKSSSFLVLQEECKRFKSVCRCKTFRACVLFSFSVCLDKLLRSDILVEGTWMCSGAFLLGWLNELWMWRSSSVQGFLHGGASPQCKAPFQDSSPLNLCLFHEMRLFAEAEECALPSFPPSHHNQISMQDNRRNLWWIKKKKSTTTYPQS